MSNIPHYFLEIHYYEQNVVDLAFVIPTFKQI